MYGLEVYILYHISAITYKTCYIRYRLELVKHHLLTLSVSRATIDGVNDARFL